MMEACRSRFTAAEGGARLAAAAATKNILAVEYASFIPVRLLYEKAYQIRGSLFDGSKRSIYITRSTRVDVVAFEMKILTDLETVAAKAYDDVYDWTAELEKKEVVICTSSVLKRILEQKVLMMSNINVMIVDSCHLIYKDDNLKYIMQVYKSCTQTDQPTILSLTYPLFNSNKKDPQQETDGEMGVYENLDDFNMYEKLEWKVEELERELCCEMDLAEDIDGGKRISSSITKPRELIIEYGPRPLDEYLPEVYKELEAFMRDTVQTALEFIEDHRHDPTEIYGDELYEEFMNIPDPTIDPKLIFKQFLYVLDQLGPYAADKAAFCLLLKIEKYKVKIPYERHFLLYCLCTTIFLKIRCYADLIFSQYEDEWEKIKTFSSPKVLRLAEILEKFQPPDVRDRNNGINRDNSGLSGPDIGLSGPDIGLSGRDISVDDSLPESPENETVNDILSKNTEKMLNDIEKCDFVSLGNKIQDTVFTYEAGLKEILDLPTENNSENPPNISKKEKHAKNANNKNKNWPESNTISGPDIKVESKNNSTDFLNPDTHLSGTDIKGNELMIPQKGLLGFTRRAGYRLRGRTRLQRNNAARVLQMQQNPDALCGIIFMKEALIAKIMFLIIVDMSRCNSHLAYLCAQYCCTDNPADPGTEPKECQRQGKKQEEVLKKFRMHECNLLLATSALEEGIDLPRCNLVLRWDVPPSYRSYGLCRARARAGRATAALLCSHDARSTAALLHNVAVYRELDQIISRKCGCGVQDEPPQSEEDHADTFNYFIKPYTPNENKQNTDTDLEDSKDSDTSTKDDEKKDLEDDPNRQTNKYKNTTKKDLKNDSNKKRKHKISLKDLEEVKDKSEISSDDESDKNSVASDVYNVACKENADEFSNDDGSCEDFDKVICKNENVVANSEINQQKYSNDNKSELKIKIKKESKKNQSEINENDIEIKTNDKNRSTINEINKTANINSNIDNNYKLEEHQTVLQTKSNKICEIETKNKDNENFNETLKIEIKTQNNIINDENLTNNDLIDIKENEATDNKSESDENIQKINKNYSKTDNIQSDNIENVLHKNKMEDNKNIDDDLTNPTINCKKCDKVGLSGCVCVNMSPFSNFVNQANSDINKCYSKKSVNDINGASVDLSSAIALINRYCGKLPSDTFTRLAPQWWMEEIHLPVPGSAETRPAFVCTLRLPLNCPVKYNIVGHPMPTKVLARRMVALQACRILHKSGELDNQLMPIGKENFKAVELFTSIAGCGSSDNTDPNDSARPGTTKRRQYYYKRTAWAFTDCQPVIDTSDSEIDAPSTGQADVENIKTKEKVGKPKETGKKRNMLYAIVSKLWCALPERYNTRGRRLHAPQNASQAIGILMAREEPDNLQIPAFPVYTRSGEVRVSVEHVAGADTRMSPRRAAKVRRFMRFVFSEVLRVRRRGMKLHSDGNYYNNYYIVPTVKTTLKNGTSKIDVDWAFLELIYQHTEDKKLSDIEKPILWQEEESKGDKERKRGRKKKMLNPLLKSNETFVFDAEKYREAVVTPWYRNQDQPQFFLVAEICWNLTPDSSFPSTTHQSFRDYYNTKYGVTLTQKEQPLLDVDHTSARLNLLTPRYVNRKGVALPVSSERTRRAKRDRLDQKQILIPELCRVHPFAAPLWFSTVALPCVLYRINALLIADEIRRAVAIDVGLGIPKINEHTMPGFQWPALDFGWSLAEVLSADSEKNEKKKEEEEQKREQREKELKEKEDLEKQQKNDKEKIEEESVKGEVKEKTINDILQEKENEAGFEIGTWSNDMASSIPEESEYDEMMEPLPPNLTFCTSASGGNNWSDPVPKPKFSQFNPAKNFSMADSDDSFMSSDLDSDDTDLDFEGSDEDTDISGFSSSKNANATMGVRIEYKTAHEAEAFDIERTKKVNPAPLPDDEDDLNDRAEHDRLIRQGSAPQEFIEKFRASVSQHKEDIINQCHLIPHNKEITEILPDKENYEKSTKNYQNYHDAVTELFPFGAQELIVHNGQIDVESIEKNKRVILGELKKKLPDEKIKKLNCFSMKDINIDSPEYVNEKVVNVGFDTKEGYEDMCKGEKTFQPYYVDSKSSKEFDFDYQPKLEGHPGPSPSVILQALTMSNANDGINLERLETIGDSFLKFAITAYLYCAHPTVHEGKLSHMRSKQVSNLNLYRLGRNKRLGARMIASKFEPHDNWLPPCHKPPPTLHPRPNGEGQDIPQQLETPQDSAGCFIPYNLITQHSIPDKSIADCVEALIGAYLLECGPRGALLFMSWLGIRVLPCHRVPLPRPPRAAQQVHAQKSSPPSTPRRQRSTSSSSSCSSDDDQELHQQEVFPEHDWSWPGRAVGSLQPYKDQHGNWMQPIFGELKAPPSPLLRYIEDPEGELEQMLSGYDALERTLQYRFKDRSLLLQALTHASHHSNRLTDCYQRLEFLGDAILDYLITRHLYEDPRRHCPGALTDLRSALVNNTIFATLAARHGFHKYFRHMSPGLNEVLTKYVKIQEENGHSISEEHYLIQEDEMEQAEDVEVPKALGDLFESVAGAIFLDSGMSLGAVWKSYVNLMGAELEAFSAAAPKSPVRELLEAEPDTAKFGKPERLADGRRVRVCVEVFGRGTFKGVGRNYRIAKGTAARCALRHLRSACV